MVLATPAVAGPPYLTDDPEPTDTGHFENYLFVEGTRAGHQFGGPPVGIEINYGPMADTQLTFSFPLNPDPGPGGMGIVWAPLGAGIKYRFIEEDEDGWRPQVAFFPSIAIPVGSASHSSPVTELLPIWMQKSFGPDWTMFGGGGFTNNPGTGNRDFINYGLAVQRQVAPKLALGGEIFGQTRDSADDAASTAIGLAVLYDLSDEWHLIGSVNTGVINRQADEFGFNIAVKWTI
jgi:Putative MetA-pathway of phenol degradation